MLDSGRLYLRQSSNNHQVKQDKIPEISWSVEGQGARVTVDYSVYKVARLGRTLAVTYSHADENRVAALQQEGGVRCSPKLL